jgi:hypothetical protein
MNGFKHKKYRIVRKAVNKELSNFLYNYLIIKSNVVYNLQMDNYLPKFEEDWGTFDDVMIKDTGSYCCYSDFAMEALLLKLQSKIENEIDIKLVPNYTYTRLYRTGAELHKHKDRYSCGISSTLNLGGDEWPIFIEGIKIILKPGDMVIYDGINCEHWREKFTGEKCAQVFLHYQEVNKKSLGNAFDGRPSVGFPKAYLKKI